MSAVVIALGVVTILVDPPALGRDDCVRTVVVVPRVVLWLLNVVAYRRSSHDEERN